MVKAGHDVDNIGELVMLDTLLKHSLISKLCLQITN